MRPLSEMAGGGAFHKIPLIAKGIAKQRRKKIGKNRKEQGDARFSCRVWSCGGRDPPAQGADLLKLALLGGSRPSPYIRRALVFLWIASALPYHPLRL